MRRSRWWRTASPASAIISREDRTIREARIFRLELDNLGNIVVAGGGRGAGPSTGSGQAAPTLPGASAAMFAAAMSLQAAEAAPTTREIAAVTAARAQSVAAMQKWTAINAQVTALNVKRKAAGLPLITVGK